MIRARIPADEVTLWSIVEEHLDEAGFLYWMRRGCLQSPEYDLDKIAAAPEARLLAHVDALVVGGRAVRERILLPAVHDEQADPERVAAAALALLSSEHPQLALELVVAALPRHRGERLEALGEALSLARIPEAPRRLVAALAKDPEPAVAAVALRALAAYRADPGPMLDGFLRSEEPATVQAALRVAAAVPRRDRLRACERLLGSENATTRDRALDAALLMGSDRAWSLCVERAINPVNADQHCVFLCGLLGEAREHERLARLLDAGTLVPAVLWSMGFAGRPCHAESAIGLLDHPTERVAKLAGEVFTSVTGYVPAKPDAGSAGAREPDDDEPVAFYEDDLDADLVPAHADQLPALDRGAAQAWWDEHRDRFVATSRYVLGQPLSIAAVHRALRRGSARRRPPWALGLQIASGGRYVVSTGALCEHQSRELESFATSDPTVLGLLLDGGRSAGGRRDTDRIQPSLASDGTA